MEPQEFTAMADRIIQGRQEMTIAFEQESAIKTRVLQQVFDAMKHCLPHISSKLRFIYPYGSGIFLLRKPNGEELYLSESGTFFVHDKEGVEPLTIDKVIRDRWNLREMVLAISEEMEANLKGQKNKIAGVEQTTKKISAVAVLLEGVR